MARVLGGVALAAVVAAGPAAAQLWPNGSGPGADVLRTSIEQYQRLSPVEAERAAPLPVAQPAASRGVAGTPVVLRDRPALRQRTTVPTTRRGVRRTSIAPRGTSRVMDDTRLEQDIEARQRRIDDLQRRIETDRALLEQRRGDLPSFTPIPSAAAATLPPSAPPAPTATLR